MKKIIEDEIGEYAIDASKITSVFYYKSRGYSKTYIVEVRIVNSNVSTALRLEYHDEARAYRTFHQLHQHIV